MRRQGRCLEASAPAHKCSERKAWSTFMVRTPEPEHSRKPNIHPNPECSSRRFTVGRAQAGRMFVSGPLYKHLPTTVTSLFTLKSPISSHFQKSHFPSSTIVTAIHTSTTTPKQKTKTRKNKTKKNELSCQVSYARSHVEPE